MINATTLLLQFVGAFTAIIVVPTLLFMAFMASLIGLRWGVSSFLNWVVGDGTTSGFSRAMYKVSPSASAWYDHMTYRPFKGSPRGWQLRMGQKFGIKKWQI